MKSVNQDSGNACVIFGDFVKSTRLQNNIIARDAASNAGMLPSNFSKMEHGALRPPMDPEKQKRLAVSIGIALGSDEASRFFDLAGSATASIPADLADIISREEALPLLLRTIGNKRLGQSEIERLVSLVRDTNVQLQNTSSQPR
jgi:transcriptional regulator with XRE-family HTH domain